MQDVLLSWVPDDDRMYRVILNGGDLAAAITQLDEIGDSSAMVDAILATRLPSNL